ncbi:MAG: fibronectin type III domain-containing protein, partial [Candidatus Kapaibacterium sp.]
MNRILSSLSPFLLLMALTFVSSSCSKDSSTTGPNTSSTIATNLKVVTINASSVQVSWTRGSGDASTDTIFATTASGEIFQWLAPSSTSSLNLTGFQSGKVYTFTIHSIGGVSAGVSWSSICGPPTNVIVTTINSTSVQVTWARAIGDAGQDTAVALASTGESISVASASYTVTMTGLIVGKTYLITVHGLGGSSGAVTWPTGGSSNPATNLLVDALSSTSIGVRWTRASDDLTADTVYAVTSVGDSSSVIASSSSSSAILTGLQGQKAYTITVHSFGGTSTGITWATADRYAPVRIYETSAPGRQSGLSLTPGAVTSLSVALVATQGLVDLSLATDLTVHGSNISLESAGVAGSGIPTGLRSVLLGDDAYIVRGGLDSDYYS